MRDERVLFRGVSFALKPGGVLQIIGPNGIGKSTLLRAIAERQLPGNFCYISHKNNFHPALTVTDNLRFLQVLLSGSQALNSALQYFGMQQCANKITNELSAGQLQCSSLARLCLTTVKLWILDEPTVNLDLSAQQLFLNLCAQHVQNGGTIICATHTILAIATVDSKVLRLQEYV